MSDKMEKAVSIAANTIALALGVYGAAKAVLNLNALIKNTK